MNPGATTEAKDIQNGKSQKPEASGIERGDRMAEYMLDVELV